MATNPARPIARRARSAAVWEPHELFVVAPVVAGKVYRLDIYKQNVWNGPVDFKILGSGTVITAPVFASTPRAMRLDNNGVFVGNYVIDPSVPTRSERCAR